MDMTCTRHTCWGSIQVTYQTGLKSTKPLPVANGLFMKSATKAVESKGKRKADGHAGQASPAKRGAGQSKAPEATSSGYLKHLHYDNLRTRRHNRSHATIPCVLLEHQYFGWFLKIKYLSMIKLSVCSPHSGVRVFGAWSPTPMV
ncbi:hypothetical protein EDB19DRAFT_2022075 [Suillus lakei]|nr:hypothetical protein EDB19DRAFT_2022075 [Suillus lakei]